MTATEAIPQPPVATVDRIRSETMKENTDMQEAIKETKETLNQTKERMKRMLNEVPEDRLNWAPSDSARTPIQIVAHSAHAIFNIHEMLDGRPFPITDTVQAEVHFKEWESKFTSRDQVVAELDKNCDNFIAWLDRLTAEKYEATAQGPFGMGNFPVSAGLGFPAMHMNGHISQLEYVQTIYGDRIWHF